LSSHSLWAVYQSEKLRKSYYFQKPYKAKVRNPTLKTMVSRNFEGQECEQLSGIRYTFSSMCTYGLFGNISYGAYEGKLLRILICHFIRDRVDLFTLSRRGGISRQNKEPQAEGPPVVRIKLL